MKNSRIYRWKWFVLIKSFTISKHRRNMIESRFYGTVIIFFFVILQGISLRLCEGFIKNVKYKQELNT